MKQIVLAGATLGLLSSTAALARPEEPSFAVVDGAGLVFVNLEDKAEIALVDVANRGVVYADALPGREEPTGLALDMALGLLISARNNNVAKLIDAKTGKDLRALKIGKGPDAVILDERRRRAFIPCADGTLSVVSLAAVDKVEVVQTVSTQKGSKTGALDPETGQLYLPAVEYAPPEAEGARPKPLPGAFQILVVFERRQPRPKISGILS